MNTPESGMHPARNGARGTEAWWALPRWERWLWIGAALGLVLLFLMGGIPLLVLSNEQWANDQITTPLFAIQNLLGIVVWPAWAFLLFRVLWHLRHELPLRGLWLIVLSGAGMFAFYEYELLAELVAGPDAPPFRLPPAALPLGIAVAALFGLGSVVLIIEVALMIVRSSRPHA